MRQLPWVVVTAVAVTLALVATVLTVVVSGRAARIDDQLRHSNAVLLAQQAKQVGTTEPTTSLQLALAAYRENPNSSEAFGALLQQRLYWHGTDRVFPEPGELEELHSSADGRVVLTVPAGPEHPVSLWRDMTSSEPTRHELPVDDANLLRLSPDGRWLAESDGSTVKLWDLTRPNEPRILREDGPDITALRFSPDGRSLAAAPATRVGDAASIELWTTESGESVPNAVHLAPDAVAAEAYPTEHGILLHEEVEAGGKRTALRDPATGAEIRSFGHDDVLGSGAAVANCTDGVVTVRDSASGAVRGRRSGVECPIRWDVSGQYLLLSQADAKTGTEVVHWPSWRGRVVTNPAQERALGGVALVSSSSAGEPNAVTIGDGVLRSGRLTTVDANEQVATVPSERTDRAPKRNRAITHTDTGELALLDSDGRIARQVPVRGHVDEVSFDKQGEHVLAVGGGRLRIYDGTTLKLEHDKVLPPGRSAIAPTVSIHPKAKDEVLVTAWGQLTSWNPRTGEQTADPLRLVPNGRDAGSTTLRPRHGELLVDQGDGVSLWDVERRERVHTFRVNTFRGGEPVIDDYGSTAAVISGDGDEVALFDLDRKRPLPRIDTKADVIHGLVGRYLFLEGGQNFQVWDWRERTLVTDIPLDDGYRKNRRDVHDRDRFDHLVLDSTPGRREVLSLEPEDWYERLCGLSDRGFTSTERRMLPEGVRTDPPCESQL